MSAYKPLHFIHESIKVIFDRPQTYEKKPDCPNGFIWNDKTYRVTKNLEEWHDYARKGRMAANMRPVHAEAAETKGSWGVARFYFRLRVDTGKIYEIYYDRAPKGSKHRKGAWFLVGELIEA